MTKKISTPINPPLKGWKSKIVIPAWKRITETTAIALKPSISGRYEIFIFLVKTTKDGKCNEIRIYNNNNQPQSFRRKIYELTMLLSVTSREQLVSDEGYIRLCFSSLIFFFLTIEWVCAFLNLFPLTVVYPLSFNQSAISL